MTLNQVALWIGYAFMICAGLAAIAFVFGWTCNYIYQKIVQAVGLKDLWDGYNKYRESLKEK